MLKKMKITWDQLQVGDMFSDGSFVTEILEWQMMPCYVLKFSDKLEDQIIAGETHLFKSIIKDKLGMNRFADYTHSKEIRELQDIKENYWLTCKDIYDAFNHNMNVVMLNNYNEETKLEFIEPYNNGEPQKCRCIVTNYHTYLINGFVSHNCGSDQVKAQQHSATIIMNTLDAFGTSPIIQGAVKLKTTEERRQYIYENLKELYHSAGIKQDDFNIMMVAKKLTSYKRSDEGTRPVRDDECCDIVSTTVIGNKNNIFKYSELRTGYGMLTRPTKQEIEKDAANGLMI